MGLEGDRDRLEALGYDAELGLLDSAATADADLGKLLRGKQRDCVLIGAGGARCPGTSICLNPSSTRSTHVRRTPRFASTVGRSIRSMPFKGGCPEVREKLDSTVPGALRPVGIWALGCPERLAEPATQVSALNLLKGKGLPTAALFCGCAEQLCSKTPQSP